MSRFEFSRPRAKLAFTGVAMAAITLGVLVVLPAQLDSPRATTVFLSEANAATGAAAEVIVTPPRSEETIAANRDAHADADCAAEAQTLASKHPQSGSRGRTAS